MIIAQCINAREQDLSLLMLQEGYAMVDRFAVYNSVFEEPYITAESNARAEGVGVWHIDGEQGFSVRQTMVWLFGGAFVLALFVIGAFSVLSVIIMRGFRQVTEAQNQHIALAEREKQLKKKERSIIAKMLDAEIKANKSKIEAYLVVYEEMLAGLKDPERQPKYKKAGDIIQIQPSLDRAVFDRNTDKLDILGEKLSSQVVHFYADVKPKAEYMNLEPDTPLDEAISTVEAMVKEARKLNGFADALIDMFNDAGMSAIDFADF